MNENFLPLRRELRNHWVYTDSQYLHLWLEMLYSARFSYNPKTEVFKGVIYTINRSEFLFSRPSYSQRLNIPDNRVRKAIELLIKDNMIEVVISLGKNKPTIYKIINYDLYNNPPSETVGGVSLQELSTKWTPSGHQVDTKSPPLKKKEKKEKNEKENIYRAFKHLSITEKQFNKLISDGYTKENVDEILDRIENFSGNKKYNSLNLTARNWLKNKKEVVKVEQKKPVDHKLLYKGLLSKKRDLESETEDGIESHAVFGNEPYYHKCVRELGEVNERLRELEKQGEHC